MAPKKSSGLHQKAAKTTKHDDSDKVADPSPPLRTDASAPPPAPAVPATPPAAVASAPAVTIKSAKDSGKGKQSSLAAAAATLPPPPPKQNQSASKKPQIGFVPPGALTGGSKDRRNHFENGFEEHFHVPQRIATAPVQLVEAVNDFHFAMMNDVPRNEFYWNMLKQHIVPGVTGVLEIGAGSGLLSMMAAKLGAKWVVAVEGSLEMSRLAANNVKANNFGDIVKVLNMMSTELEPQHLPGVPDLLVSEIFGTLLLGESAHDYIVDIRDRILKAPTPYPRGPASRPEVTILPRYGIQYAVLIECPTLESICSVGSWNGLDLSEVNALRDTASTVFTKKYGFRMSSVEYRELCAPIPLVDIDFNTYVVEQVEDPESDLVTPFQVTATESGTAHAAMFFWVAEHPNAAAADSSSADGKFVMSTNPTDTRNNFPRDMQWGQALQLLDASTEDLPTSRPVDLKMEKGKSYWLNVRRSLDSVLLQFDLRDLEDAEE